MDDTLRTRIYDAAMEEMLRVGLDDFNIDRVARRAGVERSRITAHWPDRRLLLMDTLNTRAAEAAPVPDTGTLRGDLLALAASLDAIAASPAGRQWFRRMLPGGRDVDLHDVGADFWDIRFATVGVILRRAAERGEVRDDLDHGDALRMFAAAYYFDVIWGDAPVRPDYGATVIDLFIRAVAR